MEEKATNALEVATKAYEERKEKKTQEMIERFI